MEPIHERKAFRAGIPLGDETREFLLSNGLQRVLRFSLFISLFLSTCSTRQLPTDSITSHKHLQLSHAAEEQNRI